MHLPEVKAEMLDLFVDDCVCYYEETQNKLQEFLTDLLLFSSVEICVLKLLVGFPGKIGTKIKGTICVPCLYQYFLSLAVHTRMSAHCAYVVWKTNHDVVNDFVAKA